MKKRLLRTLLLATILCLTLTSCLNGSFSEAVTSEPKSSSSLNYETDYTFDVYYGHFRSAFTLHMSVPTSLYSYYERKSHFLSSDGDYARFATPSALKIVAENLKNVTSEAPYSDEQFANAVLTVVRQIPYVKSATKYPVEALVENSGDCDVLSLLAASIMNAGGLDVVLLYYKSLSPTHMNIGVYLPNKPVYRSLWSEPTGFEYNNKTYWMAECTSQGDWKVGDRPGLLADVKPRVIPLGGAEKNSPGQVSSSIDRPLASSSISVTVSPDNSSLEGDERSLMIVGEVSPALAEKNVTMYVGRKGLAFETFDSVTDENGEYYFAWNFTQAGKYSITTSWSGNSDYGGSDSENLTVFVEVYEPILEDYYTVSPPQDPMGRANSALFGSATSQGPKYVLEGNVSGTGLLLSGEFIVLSDNDTRTPMVELTIPQVERVIYFPRTRRAITVVMNEEQVVNQPVENNQLGFILRQDGEENYSASVGVLETQQISHISRVLQESRTTYMNASDVAEKNKWYRVEATMSRNSTNAKLYEMNDTLLENTAAPESSRSGEMGILMAYPPNSILAFKNLKVSTLDEPKTRTVAKEEQTQTSEFVWLVQCIAGAVFVAIGFAAVGYVRRRRKSCQTKYSGQ